MKNNDLILLGLAAVAIFCFFKGRITVNTNADGTPAGSIAGAAQGQQTTGQTAGTAAVTAANEYDIWSPANTGDSVDSTSAS